MEINLKEELKARLFAFREELQSLATIEQQGADTVELDQARVGRLSRMDALQGQAMSVETKRRRQQLLKDISAALGRLDDDTYGECTECLEPINIERLRINPAVPLCVKCASLAERS